MIVCLHVPCSLCFAKIQLQFGACCDVHNLRRAHFLQRSRSAVLQRLCNIRVQLRSNAFGFTRTFAKKHVKLCGATTCLGGLFFFACASVYASLCIVAFLRTLALYFLENTRKACVCSRAQSCVIVCGMIRKAHFQPTLPARACKAQQTRERRSYVRL